MLAFKVPLPGDSTAAGEGRFLEGGGVPGFHVNGNQQRSGTTTRRMQVKQARWTMNERSFARVHQGARAEVGWPWR